MILVQSYLNNVRSGVAVPMNNQVLGVFPSDEVTPSPPVTTPPRQTQIKNRVLEATYLIYLRLKYIDFIFLIMQSSKKGVKVFFLWIRLLILMHLGCVQQFFRHANRLYKTQQTY